MSSEQDIQKLLTEIRTFTRDVKQRTDKVTKGPWKFMERPPASRVDHGWRIIATIGMDMILAATREHYLRVEGGRERRNKEDTAREGRFLEAAREDIPALCALLERADAAIRLLMGPQVATDADVIRIHAREVWSMAKGHDLPVGVEKALYNLGAALGEHDWP